MGLAMLTPGVKGLAHIHYTFLNEVAPCVPALATAEIPSIFWLVVFEHVNVKIYDFLNKRNKNQRCNWLSANK